MRYTVISALAGLLALGTFGAAQPPENTETVKALENRIAKERRLLNDFGGLIRYGSENTEIPPPATGENRVIFLGDQVTERWGTGAAKFFPGKPYFNRGIENQNTEQLLIRFRQDVISLKPKAVVIQGGTNDLAAINGPGTEGTISENIMSMVELAKVHHIRVVLASLTPVCDCYTKQTGLRPQGKIIGLNGWLKRYAAESGSTYLNYYQALVNGRDFRKELTVDGLLPNDAGYQVMAPVAEQAIEQALGEKGVQ